ncbi:MAG TPA: response regulator transcription factor [Blastocatellia bacterium]|nr:response regulator transcription factor [Blastocatellia bacterium]
MEKILIVDDDVALCELVTEYLEPLGFQIEAVHRGDTAADRAVEGHHSLVVLDVMLPGVNGLEVLRQIRAVSKIPVLMLTARGDEIDRIVGLEIGADDYLPKPFNPRELAARIRAILRRSGSDSAEGHNIVVGDVEMETGTRVVRRAGETIELTVVEYDLLEKLLRAAGRTVTREALTREVLGRSSSPFDRSIDMHISNLRKKLGHRVGEADRIKTVRGVGYIYAQTANKDRR